MERIEIVVNGDSRDGHGIGDVLHRSTKDERPPLIEKANGPLLLFAAHLGESTPDLAFHTIDQPIECSMESWRTNPHHDASAVLDRQIRRLHRTAGHERAPESIDKRPQHGDDRFMRRVRSRHRDPPDPSCSTCTETREAPCA